MSTFLTLLNQEFFTTNEVTRILTPVIRALRGTFIHVDARLMANTGPINY